MFDVRYYVTRFFTETPGWRYAFEKKIVFIGLPANVETALLALAYLRGAIDAILKGRLREGAVHGVSEARDYKLGAAQRIQQTITSEKRGINMADSETTALIHLELKRDRGGVCIQSPKHQRQSVNEYWPEPRQRLFPWPRRWRAGQPVCSAHQPDADRVT